MSLPKKGDNTRKSQASYNKTYREKNKAMCVTVNFHMTDEREAELYNKLKSYKTTKQVVLTALEQFFANNP